MAQVKIKSNHPFTKRQLESLNKELSKISSVEIQALRGFTDLPTQNKNITDIKILHSPFMLAVFLDFTDYSVPDHPQYETYKIDADGSIDYNIKRSMKFNSLADRVSFFNQLTPIQFNYVKK